MAGYSRFAQYYDILTKNIEYKKRAEYFNLIIEKFNGKKEILLDLGCGTGSLSEEMAILGYDVIGVDISQEMLSIALDKKFASGLNIQYLYQDMTKLDMFGTVDVTICALDAINHLSGKEDVKKAFAKVSLFSNPDALFIFDVNTPHKHKSILGDNIFIYDTEEVYCIWQNHYVENDCKAEIYLDFFERVNGTDTYYKSSEEFTEIAYTSEELDKILGENDFEVLAHYDYDSFNEPGEKSEKIIFVARKAGKK